MNILIIEDEEPAVQRLKRLLKEAAPNAIPVGEADSVSACIKWKNAHSWPDLIISDIQLADGLSFDFFEKYPPDCPVIFTTAFDEYAIKSFDVLSIDYLLKPIDIEKLKNAIAKVQKLSAGKQDFTHLQLLLSGIVSKEYKERFLVKRGDELISVSTDSVCYLFAHGKNTFIRTASDTFLCDYTLDELEQQLNPKDFFRLSRSVFSRIGGIKKVTRHFSQRLKIELQPDLKEEVYVSKERASAFKEWMGH